MTLVFATESQGPVLTELPPLLICGWREWAGLPEMGVKRVKAKIDTGARSSALHAFDLQTFDKDGREYVKFAVHPIQHNDQAEVAVEIPILERRFIRSSNGIANERIVVRTQLRMLGQSFEIDLTLANRDAMGFRMLIGREALRERFLVDASQSFLGGRVRHRRPRTPSTKHPS